MVLVVFNEQLSCYGCPVRTSEKFVGHVNVGGTCLK